MHKATDVNQMFHMSQNRRFETKYKTNKNASV